MNLLHLDLPFVIVAAVIAALLLWGGHYFFRPPHQRLDPPWTYVYGVASCLAGLAAGCAITSDPLMSLADVVIVFALAGAPVFVFYRIDSAAEKGHVYTDLEAENTQLKIMLDEALHGGEK